VRCLGLDAPPLSRARSAGDGRADHDHRAGRHTARWIAQARQSGGQRPGAGIRLFGTYHPHASIGWDNTQRNPSATAESVATNATPDAFEPACGKPGPGSTRARIKRLWSRSTAAGLQSGFWCADTPAPACVGGVPEGGQTAWWWEPDGQSDASTMPSVVGIALGHHRVTATWYDAVTSNSYPNHLGEQRRASC
jgi:hypothetical protein